MPEEREEPKTGKDEDLLREVREDFAYVKAHWDENYSEAEKDMDAVLCIPPDDFRNDRKNRPCLWPDELSQYVNQTNNNIRQTKRAMKVSPRGEEAKDEDAEHRQAYIQGIEYASKAQSIYATAFESCVECGFGYWRVSLRVTGPNGEQEPRIVRIPNWSTVWPDPDAKEADFSDSNLYFVTDTMRQTTFAKRFKDAEKKSFTGADSQIAPGWLQGENITVAEWWKRTEHKDKDGQKSYSVVQRITNGFEILETNEWIGSWIPIIGCFGLEKYKRTEGTTKRVFLSLIRRARGSQQMLAYVASQQAEEFGMAPRAPYLVIKGQVDPKVWGEANDQPYAFLEWEIPKGWAPQWGPPPPPQRNPFVPNAAAYSQAYEQWRRSIQASVGIMPLPTTAQRQNEKSGIALQKIQSQESMGSFHFTDNFIRALVNSGIQVNELITKLAELDSLPRILMGKDQKGQDKQIKVAKADSEHLPEADYFFADRGEFDISVSDGPSEMSQREEISEFVDMLLQTLPSMGIAPQLVQQIVAIAIRLKNIGTYGDEIADLLAPPDQQDIPPQAKAMIAQAQAQTQQAMQEVQKLQLEKVGKVVEMQGKKELAQVDFAARMAEADKDRETKLAVAEVMTKAQSVSERLAAVEDLMKQFHSQAHELSMSLTQQQHEKQMAQQQQQAQSELAAQNAIHASDQSAQDADQEQVSQPSATGE